MPQNGPKMAQNDPKWPKYDPKWPKNYPKWPKITPKWPKNDARIYALFPQILLTEKAVLLTFSLLECMYILFEREDISNGGFQFGLKSNS